MRQSMLRAEARHALRLELEPVPCPQLPELLRVEVGLLHEGPHLVKEVLEAARADDLEDPAGSIPRVPERVPLVARLEGEVPDLRVDDLVAQQRSHPSLQHEAVLVLA